MNVPCDSPWPIDDDLANESDLPEEVQMNIKPNDHPTPHKKAPATLDDINDKLSDLLEEMAGLRECIEDRWPPAGGTQTVGPWGFGR